MTLGDASYISMDKSKFELDMIYDYLSNQSYWAKGRSLEAVKLSIENSRCYGIFLKAGEKQIGFARVATDYVVFAWIMDVFILNGHRTMGYGRKLMDHIMHDAALKNVNGFGLRTNDAHSFYASYGFDIVDEPQTWLFKKN